MQNMSPEELAKMAAQGDQQAAPAAPAEEAAPVAAAAPAPAETTAPASKPPLANAIIAATKKAKAKK